MKPIDMLKSKVLGKGSKASALTHVFDFAREFSCLGEIIGREFEVKDATGHVVVTIHQKPITLAQLNHFMQEYEILLKIEDEQMKKSTAKSKGRLGR